MPASRKQMSPEELGFDLALAFQKSSVLPIVKECLDAADKNQRSWRFKVGTETADDVGITREWIVFEVFLFGQAILAYFKGNNTGNRVLKSFHQACGEEFVRHNFFDSLEGFGTVLTERYEYYLDTLKQAEPNNLLLLSMRIAKRIVGGKTNPIHFPSIALYYSEMSMAYGRLVRDVMNNIDLVV